MTGVWSKHLSHLVDRQKGRCAICKGPFGVGEEAPTVDHKIPQSRRGSDKMSNLRAAHKKCNQERGNRPLGDRQRSPHIDRRQKIIAEAYQRAALSLAEEQDD